MYLYWTTVFFHFGWKSEVTLCFVYYYYTHNIYSLHWSFYSIRFVILLYFYWPSVFFQFTLTLDNIKSTSDSATSNHNNKNAKIRDDSKNTTEDDLKCSSSNNFTKKTIPEVKIHLKTIPSPSWQTLILVLIIQAVMQKKSR